MPFRIYCFLGCKSGPHGTRNPCLQQKETFDEAFFWLSNHICQSTAFKHGGGNMSFEEAEEMIVAEPNQKYIVEVDEATGLAVNGETAWPDYALPDEKPDDEQDDGATDDDDDDEDDKGKGKAKGRKGKGKEKGDKGKGKVAKGKGKGPLAEI